MGIKPLPHFENPLHTFAMQYKIKVQGNVETVVLLGRKNRETVNFDIDVPALGIRTSERATYAEIKQYIK